MIPEFRTEIVNFIFKYKGTDDLTPPYREFKFEWLDSCNEELVRSVKIEHDCIRHERVWGDGDYNKAIIGDFISALERLIES
jgi:hypothetical protein